MNNTTPRFIILEGNSRTVRDTIAGINYHLLSNDEAISLHSLLVNLTYDTSGSNHTILLARLLEENGNLMNQVTRLEAELDKIDAEQYIDPYNLKA
jgi:hypothetical protein